jgi:hypothetical protein
MFFKRLMTTYLVAFATYVRVVLAQRAISNGDEITPALAFLADLDLTGWIVAGDAKLTQKKLVSQIVARHGDYVLIVKGNQPILPDDIVPLFTDPRWRQRRSPPQRGYQPIGPLGLRQSYRRPGALFMEFRRSRHACHQSFDADRRGDLEMSLV